MSEATQAGRSDDAVFEALDPRLTVYALANGMDLAKGPGYRRLEWFTEGLERGIMIELQPDGTVALDVLCWKTGRSEHLATANVEESIAIDAVSGLLDGAIEQANALSPEGG